MTAPVTASLDAETRIRELAESRPLEQQVLLTGADETLNSSARLRESVGTRAVMKPLMSVGLGS